MTKSPPPALTSFSPSSPSFFPATDTNPLPSQTPPRSPTPSAPATAYSSPYPSTPASDPPLQNPAACSCHDPPQTQMPPAPARSILRDTSPAAPESAAAAPRANPPAPSPQNVPSP